MSATSSSAPYEAVLVPALQRIQRECGYLKREELQHFAKESGIPEYRLQAVASFFPHFQLTEPARCTVKICRDMACHLAGSAETLRTLRAEAGPEIAVEGVSCLGRCDRAVAASISLRGTEHESPFHGRTAAVLHSLAVACLAGEPPRPDHDADRPSTSAGWTIDLYHGAPAEYAAVRQALAVRDEALRAAATVLTQQKGWGPDRVERFRGLAINPARPGRALEPEVEQAVLCWQTEAEWAQGPTLGGWSETLLAELGAADLRGLGGAGIPATQKWRDVRDAVRTARRRGSDDRAFIVVNGDESEPGTFKDRELLLRTPHAVVEGVLLAGLITEASQGFIYIRHEYGEQIAACRAEIARAEELGLCGPQASRLGRPFPLSVFVSPGGYICGEQSALIEAMSDRRAEPRNMPPKLETNGLLDLPTLVSNVETFAWAPYVCRRGGQAYAELGQHGWKGRRFFSISGDVRRPGVYEVPMGMTLRELIHGEACAQGMVEDRPLKAFAPSGPSGGFLPARLTVAAGLPRNHTGNPAWQAFAARHGLEPAATELDLLDLELELNLFRALSPTQALGAGVVVYAEGRDMAAEALNSIEFYRAESCGKCVPCRLGSQKLASLSAHLVEGKIGAAQWQELVPTIKELSKAIELASICGLGRSVPVPLLTAMNFFPQDIASHLAAL